jgi:hypothetical protein
MGRGPTALIAAVVGSWALASGAIGAPPTKTTPAAPAGVSTAPAEKGASPLEGLFGNTVHISGKSGDVYIYFNKDGTFTSRGPKGDTFGTWKIVGEKICTMTKGGGQSCGLVQPGRKPGDKWQTQVEGETVDVEVTPGR